MLEAATRAQLAEAARLLALNLAHYQLKYCDLPLENREELLRAQDIDEETARLIATGMENLIGVLGVVVRQDEIADETVPWSRPVAPTPAQGHVAARLGEKE